MSFLGCAVEVARTGRAENAKEAGKCFEIKPVCKEFSESLGSCIKTKKFKLDVFFEYKLHF